MPPFIWPYVGSPSELFGHPADLRPAVGAPHPVTAPLLQQEHLAARAVQGLALPYQVLQTSGEQSHQQTDHQHYTYIHPQLGCPGVLVHGVQEELLLVLLAVLPLMDSLDNQCLVEMFECEKTYLTVDTVDLRTQRTLEDVHVVVEDRPAGTVGGLAVESVLHVGLGLLH